jgi:SAM-dependent methyltransferase
MTPQQTARCYDKLAAHWNSDEFNRTNGIAQHMRAFRFASRKGNAIDIGCGSSGRIIDLMISEGFDVEGLDISPEMVRMARQRHPEVVFHLADICNWEFPKRYEFISAWDSIWHAPLAEHEAILEKLCKGLSQGGILIFTSGGVDQPGEVTNPCMGQPLYHAALGISKLLEIVSGCGCICRHLEYDQHPELHLYLIVQRAEGDDGAISPWPCGRAAAG